MATNVALYTTGGVTPPPAYVFGTVAVPITPGVATAAQTVEVWNNKGGVDADTARDLRLRVQAIVSGAAVESGIEPMDDRWVEARVVAGLNMTVVPGGWVRLGSGAWLELPDLDNDTGASLEIRVNAPGTATTETVSLVFLVGISRAQPMGSGHTDSTADGTVSRAGHFEGTEVIVWTGSLAENTVPDDKFRVPDAAWDHRGARYSKLTHLVTLSNLDSAAAALVAGEEYWNTVSLGAGVVNNTKSPKGVSLPATARPAVPAGEILRGYVLRQFDGIINTVDIESVDSLGRCGVRHAGGRNLEVGTGRARVGDRLIVRNGLDTVTVPASVTRDLYLLPEGSVELRQTTEESTDPNGYLLATATADGSTITSLIDRREDIGPRGVEINLLIDSQFKATPGLAVGDTSAPYAWPYRRPGYLYFPRPVSLVLDGSGSGTGQTRFEVEYRATGVAWGSAVSFFTSSGTDDRRPEVASAAAEPVDHGAVPEVVEILPGWEIRARCVAVPGTTVPEQARITLRVEVP